ncbi:MAG: GNAT family N-acetyltransferase [Alphaproteobacteria bacterium]
MTDLDSIKIRAAAADNANRAAELLYSTARPLFEFVYGADRGFMLAMLAAQWRAEESLFSYRHAVGAYNDAGELIGLELGFGNQDEAAIFAGSRALASAAQQTVIAEAVRQLTYFTPHTPDGSYCVHHLAVDPRAGVKGLGRRLLQDAFDRQAAAGYGVVCLDVLDNNPAVGFYLHLGMELACEVRLPRLIKEHGLPAIYRMVKDL